MSQSVLALTGVTGFVGQYVLKAALSQNYQIKALVRSPEQVKRLGLSETEQSKIRWIEGALGDNDDALLEGSDAFIHIAGLIKARRRSEYIQVNCNAAKNLARAAEKLGIARFVLLSSMAAKVPNLSDYAASKRAGEDAVSGVYSGKLSIVRAPAVFGPGDKATRPFFTMMQRGRLFVPGGADWASRKLSLVYAPDLAKVLLSAADEGIYDGQCVSPATLPSATWPQIASLCSDALGKKIQVTPAPLSILYPIAALTSVSASLFGAGHLTLGKLREFCYPDWSSQTLIPDATEPIDALSVTMKAYTSAKESRDDA